MGHKEHRKEKGEGSDVAARGSALNELASGQHGVASRRQLRALGLSDRMIETRLAAGGLHRVFPGVFAVGHRAIGREGHMLAAVLACGRRSFVSHASAAELLGLWDRKPVLIDVSSPGKAGRKLQGIHWHSAGLLVRGEVTTRAGIPCTTVARTLVDMAGQHGERTLRRLVEQAAVLRLLDLEEIDRVLSRRRRRGAPMLRRILAPWRKRTAGQRSDRLRSRLEAKMLAVSLEMGVAPPRCNVKREVEGKHCEFDFFWEEQRVVVETDGEETHGTAKAFQEDRKRDLVLSANGYRVARIAWCHLEDEPVETMARIKRMLEHG